MTDHIVETRLPVTGVRTNDDVVKCLQALYDVFAALGLGQATFEVTDAGSELFVKHKESVTPDTAAIDAALRSAGSYGLASAGAPGEPGEVEGELPRRAAGGAHVSDPTRTPRSR